MSDLVGIQIPFSGFYNSIHDSAIDDAMESCFNYDYATGTDKEIPPEVSDAMWSADVDWSAIRNEYCQNYTKAFGQRFGLTLTFDEMTSPREYNFSTDRIFCLVPRKQIDKIRKAVEAHEDYPKTIDYRFTSRSGFWSNYSNDYKNEEWTRETLDECQYEVIIQFWLDNIELKDSVEGWNMEEWYITNDFEMCNWGTVIDAQKAIEATSKHRKQVSLQTH